MDAERPGREGHPYPVERQRAVVIDLDGTAAVLANREWWEYGKCGTDEACRAVIELARVFAADGYEILILTGRPSGYRNETVAWMMRAGLVYHRVFMRGPRDRRSNREYKVDTYQTYIKDAYDVVLVIEDNQRTVEAFRKLGLTVFALPYDPAHKPAPPGVFSYDGGPA